jgi:hypothetical protein
VKPPRALLIVAAALALLNLVLNSCSLQLLAMLPPTPATPTPAPTTIVLGPRRAPATPPAPPAARPTARPTPTISPAPTPTTRPAGPGGLPFPLRTDRLAFGVQAHLFYTNRDTPLWLARQAGYGWIRQQIHWSDQEGPSKNYPWGELDRIVDDVNAYGLKLLISITSSPRFYTTNGQNGMPANPKTLGDFVAALAEHYRGRVHAIQIWNEQNLAYENGGQVSVQDGGRYVELLKEAYTRIKEVDPTIIVVSGAPACTATNAPGVAVDDLSYYRAMFSYQNGIIRNYVDVIGVHPGGSANPPDTLWPDHPSQAQGWTDDRTFYFRRIEDYRRLMEAYGMGDRQMWITEFGWATRNDSPGYEFGNQVSYEQQAAYIVGAMRRVKEQYPWVGAMFLWNLNFAPLWAQQGRPLHEQASFSIVNGDWSPRPAYLAVREYLGALRAAGEMP